MQVSVEQTTELSRKMTVSIPEDVIQTKVNAKLKSLAREIKIDGFRPGKVPLSVVKKRHGAKVRDEVTGEVIQSSYFDALKEQDLNPAGMPHIHPVEDAETKGFTYTAEFELYPVISLDGIENIEATNPTAQVEDADFEAMLTKLKDQKKTWEQVERAAQENDRLTISFEGTCEDENFTEGKVEDFEVEIGSKKMIPGFEDQLIGLEVGADKTFSVTFPEEYGNEKLANKEATFTVNVSKIEASVLPEINADFAKEYGIEDGDLEAFHTDVRSNMEKQLKQALHSELKKSVLDALFNGIQLTLPKALIDEEIKNMMKPYAENAEKQNMKLEDLNLPRDMFEEQAERRVALSLMLSNIIETQEIKLDEDKVRTMVEDVAESYDTPSEVVDWYYADDKRLNDVRQVVLEDQTVEWVMSQIKVSDETVSFDEIMSKQQQPSM